MSECAFECDCESVCLPVFVCLSVWVNIWTGFRERLCISGHLCVPSCSPCVFITPTALPAQPPGCKNLAGVKDWPGPGAGGRRGRGGGLGGSPYRSHSSQKQRGQGSPNSHPSDLCVHCLPAHPRGPARETAALPGQARRSKSQGPVIGQLSGGCTEHSDELQHARARGADRLLPGPRVMVEGCLGIAVYVYGGE